MLCFSQPLSSCFISAIHSHPAFFQSSTLILLFFFFSLQLKPHLSIMAQPYFKQEADHYAGLSQQGPLLLNVSAVTKTQFERFLERFDRFHQEQQDHYAQMMEQMQGINNAQIMEGINNAQIMEQMQGINNRLDRLDAG